MKRSDERFLFNSRKRQEEETLEHYVAELKKMTKHCDCCTLVESMIRDNIIYHMTDTKLQQTVLKNQDLQLDTQIKQIKTHELTNKQTNEIQGSTTQKVNAVHKDPSHYVKGKYNKNRREDEMNYRRGRTTGPPTSSRTGSPMPDRPRNQSRDRRTLQCARSNAQLMEGNVKNVQNTTVLHENAGHRVVQKTGKIIKDKQTVIVKVISV